MKKKCEKFIKYLLFFIVAVQITVWIVVTRLMFNTDNSKKTAVLEELSNEIETLQIKIQKG